ncbi:MAG: hypothetical protein CMI05_07785, partial [Oceanospirillaceae bacterium]|nr:hypothetical protein [Oceanospirillaceae bacterium]
MEKLTSAHNTWLDEIPISSKYDDVYFNSQNGFSESKYVYLESNNIEKLHSEPYSTIVIAETGFGVGLNFLNTLHSWTTAKKHSNHYHYISAEKHPLCSRDIARALHGLSPKFDDYIRLLLSQYPQSRQGFYRLYFNKNITLTLLFGDATACYSQLYAEVDAWYLDGFSPSKNPDMWTKDLFESIAKLSHANTT